MIYFNRNFLSNILNREGQFNIYVDGQFITIVDQGDLLDDVEGYGYDVNGKPTKFNYRDVTILKFGEETYDLVTLQKELEANPKEKEDGKDDKENSGDDPAEDDLEDAPDEPDSAPDDKAEEEPEEKEPKESIKPGSFVINERTGVRGSVFAVEGSSIGYESYNPKTMRVESYVANKRDLRVVYK